MGLPASCFRPRRNTILGPRKSLGAKFKRCYFSLDLGIIEVSTPPVTRLLGHSFGGTMSIPPIVEVAPLRLRRALFIDADPAVRETLRDVLDPRRWSVRHAANNEVALELVKESPYDLVLTSGKASGRDDVELLRKIRMVRA